MKTRNPMKKIDLRRHTQSDQINIKMGQNQFDLCKE